MGPVLVPGFEPCVAYLVEGEEAGGALRVLHHRGELDMQMGREPVGRLQRRKYSLVGR